MTGLAHIPGLAGEDLATATPQLEHRYWPDTLVPRVASTLPVDTLGSPFAARLPDRVAVQIIAVYRCLSLITDQAAALPFLAVDADGQALPDQPRIIEQPDPFEELVDTLSLVVASMVLRGNGYLNVVTSSSGDPVAAQPVDPDEVSVQWNLNRTRAEYQWRNQPVELYRPGGAGGLLHIKLLRLPGEVVGLSPIDAARMALNGSRQIDEYGRRLFSDGAMPMGVIESPLGLDGTEADNLVKQWELKHVGQRRPAVLSGGAKFNTLSLRPEEAQFLQTRYRNASEVAQLFGVPGALLEVPPEGGSSSIVYQNLATLADHFSRFCLLNYLQRIEHAWSALLPRGVYARFSLAPLLRADPKARFETYKVGVDGGWLDPAEVRAIEGSDADLLVRR